MSRCYKLIFGFVLLAASTSMAVPLAPLPEGVSPQYYFPTVVGSKWTYDDSINRQGGYGEVITKSEKKDGRFIVTVKSTSLDWVDSDATTIAQYIVSKDGVFLSAELLESDDHKAFHDPPICLLKLPFKKGDKWDRDAKTGKWPRVAVKAEKIKVPAGTFEAIRVEQESPDFGEKVTRATWWFAPSVGIVKTVINDKVVQLRSFKVPKE